MNEKEHRMNRFFGEVSHNLMHVYSRLEIFKNAVNKKLIEDPVYIREESDELSYERDLILLGFAQKNLLEEPSQKLLCARVIRQMFGEYGRISNKTRHRFERESGIINYMNYLASKN